MGLEIVVSEEGSEGSYIGKDGEACGWVLAKVNPWEDFRKTNFEDRWDEYTRLWRGIWAESIKLLSQNALRL